MTRIGGWLFRRRTWLPLPLAVVILALASRRVSMAVMIGGVAVVVAGELVRLWSVRHIGVISRTRSDRLGPVISSGPFALMRNPLYLGNILLWCGFALSAGLPWMVPIALLLLGFEYHAIVRWEEALLEERRGEDYRAYVARVPRWIPTLRPRGVLAPPSFAWGQTFFSERGTILAIAAGYLVLWLRLLI